MANFRSLMVISRDDDFTDRIKYAMQNAALAVMAEANTTPSHTLRVAYAKTILAGTASVSEMAIGVLNNSTISSEATITLTDQSGFGIPDADIQFAVNANFNAFAGASL